MYEAAASCRDIVQAPITNWEPQCLTLAGYYTVRYGLKVQLVTPYCVIHLKFYEVTLRSNVTGLCYVVMLQVCFQLITQYHVTHLQHYEVTLRGSVTSVYPPLDNTHLVG